MINCLEELDPDFTPGFVFYAGDHKGDVEMVARANLIMSGVVIFVPITTLYAYPEEHISDWPYQPYDVAKNPSDILDIINNFSQSRYELKESGVVVKR